MQTLASAPRRAVVTLAACLALLCGGLAAAHAQTVITSLPYTINTKGTYVLNSDLNYTGSSTSATLITVSASNVTIDFQGHYIAGLVSNTGQTTIGISAYEQSNVTIKNGTIAYCYEGISIGGNGSATTNSVGHVIDNMRLTYCYYYGAYLYYSPSSRITNCQVSQTGYSTLTSSAFGIAANGSGIVVEGNAVSTVSTNSSNTGYGFYNGTGDCFFRRNTVYTAKIGVYGGKYQDNLMLGCTTPFSGGVDAGGNN